MDKAAGRVAEYVAGGLLLYGAIWIMQNGSAGMDIVNRAVTVVADVGVGWATATWTTTAALLAAGIAARLVAHWTPIPRGVGGDPICAYSVIYGLGSLLLSTAALCGLVAGAISVSLSGAWWGLSLLAVALLGVIRKSAKVVRRARRIWSPAVF